MKSRAIYLTHKVLDELQSQKNVKPTTQLLLSTMNQIPRSHTYQGQRLQKLTDVQLETHHKNCLKPVVSLRFNQ